MNVLYLNTHDIGRYLEVYGYPVHTPCLQELAEDATAFSHCYCASPTCSPSRGALLTGQMPHNNGLTGLSHRGFPIHGERHLAAYLAQNGYETVLSGVQHEYLLRKEEAIGYQKNLNAEAYYDNSLPECERYLAQDRMATDQAIAYLENRKEGDKPFFLAVGFGCTHRVYPRVPEEMDTSHVKVAEPIPDTPENRKDMAAFQIAMTAVDGFCGEILETLKRTGAYGDTVVLFTTDHGLPMPNMKCTLYDTGIGVSLLLRDPRRGKTPMVDAMVSHLDVFPTLCDLLGLAKPDWLQGHSLIGLMQGTQKQVREEIFAEINYHVAYQPMRCIRTQRYKYIRKGENGYPFFPPANVDDSAPKECFNNAGFFAQPVEKEALYDTWLDPQERNNRILDPGMKDVADRMRKRLQEWQQETEDPLLAGKVPLPDTAICSTPDSYSTKTQVILPECRKNLEALRGVLQNAIK